MTTKKIDPEGNLDSELERALKTDAELVDTNADTQVVEAPVQKDKDSQTLDNQGLDNQGFKISVGGKGQKSKNTTSTRTFRLGEVPTDMFYGRECPEFAIMSLAKKSSPKDDSKRVYARLNEGDILRIFIKGVEIDGRPYPLINYVETTDENGKPKLEMFGDRSTPPYRVIKQNIPGQGEDSLWVERAVTEGQHFFYEDHIGRYVTEIKTEEGPRKLTEEEQDKMRVYAQLQQYGPKEDFNELKALQQHVHNSGQDWMGIRGTLPERLKSLDDPAQTPKPEEDANTKKSKTTRIIKRRSRSARFE